LASKGELKYLLKGTPQENTLLWEGTLSYTEEVVTVTTSKTAYFVFTCLAVLSFQSLWRLQREEAGFKQVPGPFGKVAFWSGLCFSFSMNYFKWCVWSCILPSFTPIFQSLLPSGLEGIPVLSWEGIY